jgi:hypothetical protein
VKVKAKNDFGFRVSGFKLKKAGYLPISLPDAKPGYTKSALGLQKGIQIEGPQRSLEIIIAVKRKAQISPILRSPVKKGGAPQPTV